MQPHLKKCFEHIDKLLLEPGGVITAMFSGQAENQVFFANKVTTAGKNVENWLGEVEEEMKRSVRKYLEDSVADYVKRPRTEWVCFCIANDSVLHELSGAAHVITGAQAARTVCTQRLASAVDQRN